MASIKVEFGRTLRGLRQAAGYSQEGFADAIDISRTHMGKLERGLGNPTLGTMVKVAQKLEISLTKLFAQIEKETG